MIFVFREIRRDHRSRYHVHIWWMCSENEDDKVCGNTTILLYVCTSVYYSLICAPTIRYVRRTCCVCKESLFTLIRDSPSFFFLFPPCMDVCRVQNRQRKRTRADRGKKQHLAILKSHHNREEGIKAPECSLWPLRTEWHVLKFACSSPAVSTSYAV